MSILLFYAVIMKGLEMTINRFLIALFAGALVTAAHAAPPVKPIRTTGPVLEGRYQAYHLEGALDDLNYIDGDTLWQPDDLLKRMRFVDPKDVGKYGIVCSWVCKVGGESGPIIGLNPQLKRFAR